MSYQFEAIIKKHENMDAAFIEIPFDVEKEFGAKRVKVKAYFDDVEYRGSIVRMGSPCHILGITKAIRNKIGKDAGDTVIVRIEKDDEERVIELPEDMQVLLKENKRAQQFFESLSYSNKRAYYQWITSAKKADTRERRIKQALEKLEQGLKLK